MVQELNVFYLSAVLLVPTNHSLSFYCELLYAFGGGCAVAEMYEYLQSRYYCIESGMIFSFFLPRFRDAKIDKYCGCKPW